MTIENIKRVISIIDKRLLKQLLGKEELDGEEINILSTLKSEYLTEFNNLIRVENTKNMYKNNKSKK
jgi:hypothetical protein